MNVSEDAADRWTGILLTIKRGEDPKREDLIAALQQGDSDIPGEVQLYLADLLDGEAMCRLVYNLKRLSSGNRRG